MTKLQKIKSLKKQTENYRGVHLDTTKFNQNATGIFRARFCFDNVDYSLGYHATANDAARAVNKKAKSLFRTESKAKAAGLWNIIS